MSRFDTRENQDAQAVERIAEMKSVAGLFPAIKEVLQSFDNKVFNCKLEKALQEKTGVRAIYAKKRHQWLEITVFSRGRDYTLAQCNIADMPDDKRIPAEKLIESAKERRAQLLRQAAEIENVKNHVDEIKAQLEQIKATLEAVLNPISYEAQDIYGLHCRLTYS